MKHDFELSCSHDFGNITGLALYSSIGFISFDFHKGRLSKVHAHRQMRNQGLSLNERINLLGKL